MQIYECYLKNLYATMRYPSAQKLILEYKCLYFHKKENMQLFCIIIACLITYLLNMVSVHLIYSVCGKIKSLFVFTYYALNLYHWFNNELHLVFAIIY